MSPLHLLPCPFCGSRDVEATPRDFTARVECNGIRDDGSVCGVRGPISCYAVGPEWRELTVESAVAKWNEAWDRLYGKRHE